MRKERLRALFVLQLAGTVVGDTPPASVPAPAGIVIAAAFVFCSDSFVAEGK